MFKKNIFSKNKTRVFAQKNQPYYISIHSPGKNLTWKSPTSALRQLHQLQSLRPPSRASAGAEAAGEGLKNGNLEER
jgi:hypothetical protein